MALLLTSSFTAILMKHWLKITTRMQSTPGSIAKKCRWKLKINLWLASGYWFPSKLKKKTVAILVKIYEIHTGSNVIMAWRYMMVLYPNAWYMLSFTLKQNKQIKITMSQGHHKSWSLPSPCNLNRKFEESCKFQNYRCLILYYS